MQQGPPQKKIQLQHLYLAVQKTVAKKICLDRRRTLNTFPITSDKSIPAT